MHPDPLFWLGKQVGVTGGSGFLGWHLVRQLVAYGARVRVLGLAPSERHPLLQSPEIEFVRGDVLDPLAVRRLVEGCAVIFHMAGPVAVWGPALRRMREVHLEGTRAVLSAAPADCRIVHTASVLTVGAARGGAPVTEESPFDLGKLGVDYIDAKRLAEGVALEAARRGQWVAVVNPAFLLGPEDHQPSIMGRLCVRYWKGRLLPLAPPGGINLADVRDVARGHMLAAEHARPGRRYILGGENHDLSALMNLLALAGGQPRRHFTLPWWVLGALAGLAECRARLIQREPYPCLQHVRLNHHRWFATSDRARHELGYRCRPLQETLHDTFEWFSEQSMIPARRDGAVAHLSKVLSGRLTRSLRSSKRKDSPHVSGARAPHVSGERAPHVSGGSVAADRQ